MKGIVDFHVESPLSNPLIGASKFHFPLVYKTSQMHGKQHLFLNVFAHLKRAPVQSYLIYFAS